MDWTDKHGEVIKDFLTYLNKETNSCILKGGTALSQCYGLTRFSEDIDLDGAGEGIIDICQSYANKNNYYCRIAKDTDTVKRCLIHYGGEKPLKIELSARNKSIHENEITQINGINVYTLDTLAIFKSSAYMQRDKIRDLFDVAFIVNNYYEDLSSSTQLVLRNALSFKGIEQFDYIVSNQKDDLINIDELASSFIDACDKVDILLEKDEREEMMREYSKDSAKEDIVNEQEDLEIDL